jgi:hypothetical protein
MKGNCLRREGRGERHEGRKRKRICMATYIFEESL